MRVSAEAAATDAAWRPAGTTWIGRALAAVDHLFDRVYSSAYNPLHRTGTLAALCLAVALVTGVYLLFVYEIARPYESMVAIQDDVLVGRWIRALHRYASDAAVVAVALHVLRLVVQGKTWGPRALAWITGVLLTGMMFLSALTGFVLVWDEFGQAIAVAGAKMLRLVPIFPEPPDRAFVGDRPVPAQFFFMNVFLHVAVPLGMVFFLWLHTARLARPAWFPERRVVGGALAGLVTLAILWPAPLPPAADLLAIPGRVEADWFYGFWIPLAHGAPDVALAVAIGLAAVLIAVPWLVRPRTAARPAPAVADPERCEGCQQCFQDCPYDAIQMVAGRYPERHPLRADVRTDLCVSCGLCAGSCASLAIGPEGRTAAHQLAAARRLVAQTTGAGATTVVIACRNNGRVAERLRGRAAADGTTASFEVECVGTLHPGTVSYLAGHFAGAVVVGCPAQNCLHREGAFLADARLLLERKPAIPGRISRQAVRVVHHSASEWPAIVAAIEAMSRPAAGRGSGRGRAPLRAARAAAFSAVLLGLIATGSRWPQGAPSDHSVLRLGWRLAGQVREQCRDLTPEELARRPVHMRTPRECTREVLSYDLRAFVDGTLVVDKRVKSPGLRADRPLAVEEEVAVAPGDHALKVTFTPADRDSGGRVLSLDRTLRFDRGRVVLITDEDGRLTVR
jgi:ferredoxin/coenzyme F420-reducing hydrogenase delta subunit